MTQPDALTPFPTAFAQQRLMIIEQLFPGSAAYHVPFAVRLRGELDIDALVGAVHEVVRRHESLRTVFTLVDGAAAQVVETEHRVPVEVRDLRCTPEAADERRLVELLNTDAARPFDITGRLLRVALLRLADDEHVLAVTMHHLVSDTWSCGIFVRELSAAYPALAAGRRPALPDLPVQYVDYAIWQREHLTGEVLDELLGFWRDKLGDAPPVLELPADRPRPAVQSFTGAMEQIRLTPGTSAKLTALSRELGVTPFMTALAAFQTVLGRWSGTDDIVVSTGAATRAPEVEALIGCFINIVLFRTSLAGDPTFAELVGRVRRTVLDAFDHKDLPFERLVEEIAPQRDLSHQPLTQVMFVMQNAPMPVPAIGELEVSSVHVDRAANQIDFDLQLWDAGDHFEGFIEYCGDLFDAETVRRMWAQFERLIDAAVSEPETRLSQLPLLDESEVERAVSGWNTTTAPEPGGTLYDLFARQVAEDPDRTAVHFAGGTLTYGELAARVADVAGRLRALGVGPEVTVGACFGPTPDRVVAFLAIQRAGGAYLPLDPAYPDERLEFMISDAAPALVLADDGQTDRLARLGGVRAAGLAGLPEPVPLDGRTDPANLAYVIYTSGSTGRPKGIAVVHRGVVNNIADLNRRAGAGPEDRLLVTASASFDMSIYDMVGLLAAGGAIVFGDPARGRDPIHWADLVAEHRVTIWNSAPALLEALVETAVARGVDLSSLRLAFLGGDWVSVTLPERVRRLAPALRPVVMGGATEASIHSTLHEVTTVDPEWTSIPYGRPMDNQQALVLDRAGRPAPVGVPGELYLGGVGLTRGYLRRPALTAERFVPHPYAGRYPNVPEGARLYRTGDLARYGHDGELELLGRIDQQAKIRGYRVELGEIAAALLTHEGVGDAVVVVDRDGAESRLVAYHTPVSGSVGTSDLREHLRRTLPDYMLPAVFVELERIPLSPNGKVDRRALPAVGTERPELATGYVAPGTPVEIVIAELWAEVLGVDRVGLHDDFFDLGGYSLAAMQIAALVRELLDVEVAMRAVFEAPTVAQQVRVVEAAAAEAGVDVAALAALVLEVDDLDDEAVAELLTEPNGGQPWVATS
ncbi:amino acid adenylation domain-containing protein [Amycolatopsis sp. NPDC049253]|uniref:non-ribosomal peptide synthetase n=1 Tax=Amycolatopsis sp. NPDC049253 TaxID=3155274 RepID=UPI00343AE1AD